MDTTNEINEVEEVILPNELETLKNRADMLKISYHPNIGVDKLREKVNSFLDKNNEEEKKVITGLNSGNADFIMHSDYKKLTTQQRKKRAASLIRINVTTMNPNKKEWEGEILSVGSAKLGTFKKFIPFNTIDGWHVPYIIYESMKEKKCSVFHTVKDHLGNKIRKSKLINEYSIEVLPQLTKDELKELAQRQAMSGSIDN